MPFGDPLRTNTSHRADVGDSLAELRALIDTDTNNPVTVRMFALREAYGAGRLGVHVRRNISDELSGLGLGHFPAELPDDQEKLVRLFKLGSRRHT